jgi:thiol-disulfide isomerase/thioredoxin
VVLVNLWATWCPPCVEELPTLNVFYRDYAQGAFVIIGIDDGEELSVVKDYVAQNGLTFPIWTDPDYLSEGAFNTMSLPSSYVIDRQGRVRLQWVGAISRAMLEKYVLPIIDE